MCTESTAPEAMSPKEQDRTPEEMEQLPAPVPPLMDQEVPGSVGSVSFTQTTSDALGQLLDSRLVLFRASPAETEELSATLAMSMAAPWTTMESRSEERRVGKEGRLAVLSTGE